jgi:hypothetical protein
VTKAHALVAIGLALFSVLKVDWTKLAGRGASVGLGFGLRKIAATLWPFPVTTVHLVGRRHRSATPAR